MNKMNHLTGHTRFCSHHNGQAKKEGGEYVKFNHGRNQRWRCEVCKLALAAKARDSRV